MKKPKKSISFTVPYTPAASKNRKFAYYTRKMLAHDYVSFRDVIKQITATQSAIAKVNYTKGRKVRVDMTLYKTKSMTRTDAQNFLEVICDGVKDAIGVDDCWFSGSFDWEYTESEPSIYIQVSQ